MSSASGDHADSETVVDATVEAPRRRSWWWLGVAVAVVLLAGAWVAKDQWDWLLQSGEVEAGAPVAPALSTSSDTERLFRIDADQSLVSYRVEERKVGSESEAIGTTHLVAGDIRIDTEVPADSTIGAVVVNVESFKSDSSLRDKRIQHDFLESNSYPFVEFTPTSIAGLPDAIVDGIDYDIEVSGSLAVKTTRNDEVFSGTVRLDGTTLTATMHASVLMSTYDVGPISIAGLVTTADEVELTFALVAVEVGSGTEPDSRLAFEATGAEIATGGTFSHDVLPILEASCASCHVAGQSGYSTWALDTARDAAEVAPDLALITAGRYMPPWPASTDVGVAHRNVWALDAAEVDAIAAWGDAGGPLDVDPDTPITSTADPVAEIRRDLMLTATEPYVGTLDQRDDYRCFTLDPGFTEGEWITGLAFEVDTAEVVHHSVIYKGEAALRAAADEADGADGKVGWPCYGRTELPGSGELSSQLMAWAPGQAPTVYPEGSGVAMAPGDFIIMQIHHHYDHVTPRDQSAMVVTVATPAEIGDGLDPVVSSLYLAPAEIPCTTEQSGPMCDRDNVMERIRADFGWFADGIPDFLHDQCGTAVEDFAHMTDGHASSSCDVGVSNPGEIVSVWGHMHELGESFRMTLNPGTPEEQILLDIPVWSFDWQLVYEPVETIVLERGDVIRVECSWDRSLNPDLGDVYVTWSEGTEDEMCYSTIATRSVTDA